MISPERGPGAAMIAALTDLRPGPTGPNVALSAALRSLGRPCWLPPDAGADGGVSQGGIDRHITSDAGLRAVFLSS